MQPWSMHVLPSMISHGALSRMSNFILPLEPPFRLTVNVYEPSGLTTLPSYSLVFPFLWVQLNFTQLQNIQQVCIGHCTARRPSIHVSRNCRARLRVKGEWYHKGRSGVITTDNSNQLNNKMQSCDP